MGGRTNAAIKYPINGAQLGGGRIHTITKPVGSTTSTITYTWDADGRVVSKAIDGVTESNGYNSVGQIANITNPLGSFTYTYDPNSARLNQVAYPNGQQANFDYFGPFDPLGDSGSLKDITNLVSSTQLSKFSYTYNPTGEIKTWFQQLGNSSAATVVYSMGYDADSELQAVTLTSGSSGFDGLTANQSVTYGYDAAGNRTVEQVPNFLHTFGTNNLNQLNSETDKPISVVGSTNRPAAVTVNGQGVTEDANNNYATSIQPQAGNTTPLTVVSVATDGTVATTKKHVLNTFPIQFDAAGNCVNDGVRSYQWDAANRLVQINVLNPQPPTVTDTIQFQYAGNGQCVGITEKHGSTVLSAKTFIWCADRLCEERDSTGHTVNKLFYEYGEQINGTNYYFTKDHLGSIREMTDSSGTIHARYDYDPWGRATKLSGDLDADFGFTAFYQNKSTGLDLTWYRAYDPERGRWLSRDPDTSSENDGKSVYDYAYDNPVKNTDPDGRLSTSGCGCLDKKKLQQDVNDACEKAKSVITDPSLNRCIQHRCQKPTFKCEKNCDPNTVAYQYSDITTNIFGGDETIHLCPNQFPCSGQGQDADVLIHEWAHTCGWDHFQGKGVLGDNGTLPCSH